MFKRMNLDLLITLYTNTNSKWVKDANVNAKTIKLLKLTIGVNLHDLGLSNDF